MAGGRKIPLAQYATFGTDALAASAVKALQGHRACLLANHGQIAWSGSLAKALELAAEVETLARQYIDVLTLKRPASSTTRRWTGCWKSSDPTASRPEEPPRLSGGRNIRRPAPPFALGPNGADGANIAE